MEYTLMTPPFEMRAFHEMTKKMAQTHFDWYMAEMPKRLNMLGDLYKATTGETTDILDYSLGSLVKLWGWYMNVAEIVEKSEEWKQSERERLPEWLHGDILEYEMHTGWLAVAMDIAMYFGEVLVRQHPTIQWGFVSKPKNLDGVNKPALVGFRKRRMLNPTNLLRVLTVKVMTGKKDERALVNLYHVWSENV